MEAIEFHNNDLYERMQQCECFVLLVCVCGITVPLIASVFVLEKTTHLLTIVGILTAITPTVFAFTALVNYHKAHKADLINNTNTLNKKMNWGNISLYIGGVLSILFVFIYVILTGGIKGNLMAFYFVYIPSATAVAFRTRFGLGLVSAISAICLCILYVFFYDQGFFYEQGSFYELCDVVEPNKYYYFGFSVLQITLIILLEHYTNKISNSNKKKNENE